MACAQKRGRPRLGRVRVPAHLDARQHDETKDNRQIREPEDIGQRKEIPTVEENAHTTGTKTGWGQLVHSTEMR